MSELRVVLNGKEASGRTGMTILELAEQEGVEIPTLCHSPDLHPAGACRVCVVEVEGTRTLVGSCHTPIAEGMVVHTRSAKVLAARRAIVELLLASHTGSCVTDANASNCHLHKLASGLEVGPPRFQVRRRRFYPVEDSNPYVWRDLSKCILCFKCTRACSEIAKKNVLGVGYRGSRSKIIVGFDEPLQVEACRDCGICIDYCPTGALLWPREKRGSVLPDYGDE
jgi:NADH dehydrogenase/NADH:ubiquinone oxidoreductase subunit G